MTVFIVQVLQERERSFPSTLPPACFVQRSISTISANLPSSKSAGKVSSKTSTPGTPVIVPVFNMQTLLEDVQSDPSLRLDVALLESKYVGMQLDFGKPDMDGRSLSSRSASMIGDEDNEPSDHEQWGKSLVHVGLVQRESPSLFGDKIFTWNVLYFGRGAVYCKSEKLPPQIFQWFVPLHILLPCHQRTSVNLTCRRLRLLLESELETV